MPMDAPQSREVSSPDEKLAADWLKKIEAAKARPGIKDAHARFEANRKLLRGIDPKGDGKKRMRSNLYFANLAAIKPQVYAKDPEFTVAPTKAVPETQLEAAKRFASTAECVLSEVLVKGARLKKRAKRLLSGTYTTGVGWLKLCWQEDKRADPLIQNQIKDTQDNLQRLQALRQELTDPQAGSDTDLKIAEVQQMLAGLQSQAETSVARGLALDFVLSEDLLILDESIREMGDYERAGALAHRVWMSRAKYRAQFGHDCEKGKGYTEAAGGAMQAQAQGSAGDKDAELLCVWEIWDQDSSRVFHVCDGEKGFCRPPFTPDWTGERWYPFFGLAFNEADGCFYPLSDIELIEPLVTEYNETRDDFVEDRRDARPFVVGRRGGSLTEKDLKNIKDRKGGDIVMVEGVGNNPLSNDLQAVNLGRIDPALYNTQPPRSDIEMLVGGGDAARGSVLEAKTATEAEILSQGLRGRSSERQDTMEDMLTEMGTFALQVCLLKLTTEEVQRIAGPDAVWPELSPQDVFEQVTLNVRGGSTGKPDRLQEQDRWTKLLPVIEGTIQKVSELRAQGQNELAGALVALTRETLRSFDERIDIEQFLPAPKADGQPDPQALAQQVEQLKALIKQLTEEKDKLEDQAEKGMVQAAAQIATSAQPLAAMQAFQMILAGVEAGEDQNEGQTPGLQAEDDAQAPENMAPPIQ